MNERAEERAPVRERGRKTKETKEASVEGWTVVEGGKETNKKSRVAAVSHFAWSSNREGQCDGQRGSATMKSPPSPTSREKIDTDAWSYWTTAATAMYSVKTVAWPRGGEVGGKERRGSSAKDIQY